MRYLFIKGWLFLLIFSLRVQGDPVIQCVGEDPFWLLTIEKEQALFTQLGSETRFWRVERVPLRSKSQDKEIWKGVGFSLAAMFHGRDHDSEGLGILQIEDLEEALEGRCRKIN